MSYRASIVGALSGAISFLLSVVSFCRSFFATPYRPDARAVLALDGFVRRDAAGTPARSRFLAFLKRALAHDCYRGCGFDAGRCIA